MLLDAYSMSILKNVENGESSESIAAKCAEPETGALIERRCQKAVGRSSSSSRISLARVELVA